MVFNWLEDRNDVYIYGAQLIGVSIYFALKDTYGEKIKGFLVTMWADNPKEIDGKPVFLLNDLNKKDVSILVCVAETLHQEIVDNLINNGFRHYLCVNDKKENEIMYRYYSSKDKFDCWNQMPFSTNLNQSSTISVFLARCEVDRPLKTVVDRPGYLLPVWGGTRFSDQIIEGLRDDNGINISERNKYYSELTVLYWGWKNWKADYKGLCHYRRMWDLTDKQVNNFLASDYDVLLPYPTIHFPNIYDQPKRFVEEAVWKVMKKSLKEHSPEYLEALDKVFSRKYYYNYNMIIAKEKVYDDFCSWLFTILFRMEEICGEEGVVRKLRDMGYVGESLVTLYFMHNKNNLKRIHAGRRMLV